MSRLQWTAGGLSALTVGVALGWLTAATGVATRFVPSNGQAIRVGAWETSLATGGTEADMFTRANVARTGLLALNRSETLYFSAERDDDGRRLDARCAYHVTGTAPSAKWWSLTVYADDHFLVPDPSNRYSISLKDAAGDFTLRLGAPTSDSPSQELWLPTGTAGGFSLLLRLYNPAPDVVSNTAGTRLPKITRIGECR